MTEISIDTDAILQTINETATAAIRDALKGYSFTSAVGKLVSESLAERAMTEAISAALEQVGTDELTRTLASEMQRAVVRGVVMLLQESMVSVVCKLRGVADYSPGYAQRAEEIRHQLFGGDK